MTRILAAALAAVALAVPVRADDAPKLAGAPKLAAAPRLEVAPAPKPAATPTAAAPEGGYVAPAAATVTVHVPTGGGAGYKGTGTVVWAEGGKSYIVTNYHVVEDNRGTFVVEHNTSGKRYPARIGHRSPEGDAVVLEVDTVLPAAVLGADEPAGTPVTHYGNTTGPKRGRVVGYGSVSVGNWSGEQLYTDYESDSGDSGAGVFNDRGELVGVHWGGSSGDGRRRVVPVGVVRRLLAWTTARTAPRLAARLADRNPAGAVAAAVGVAAAPKAAGPCPCPLAGGDCPGGKCAPGCDPATCQPAAPKAASVVTHYYKVGGAYLTADQVRASYPQLAPAFGLAPAAAGTCAGGTCRPAAAPTFLYAPAASPCANGRCPTAR